MNKYRIISILVITVLILVTGCSNSIKEPEKDFTWKIQIKEYEIKEKLETIEYVTLYDGSQDEIEHVVEPYQDSIFLIINLFIEKTGDEPISFKWEDLKVVDGKGIEYSRHENDTFLEIHDYEPRLTSLEIKFGQNEGWVCYEINKESLNDELKIVHSTEEGNNEIIIK